MPLFCGQKVFQFENGHLKFYFLRNSDDPSTSLQFEVASNATAKNDEATETDEADDISESKVLINS